MTTTDDTTEVAEEISNKNKSQIAQALVIQAYANSVNQQPLVDFSKTETLKDYAESINTGLKTAQTHATDYLNVIQPSIITNLSNIENYYSLHEAISIVLPDGSTEAEWLEVLTALKGQSEVYKATALGVVSQLNSLSSNLNKDSAHFTRVVSDMNAAVDGDNGVLDSIKDQLDTIQGQIDGAIAGTALSGLAILGGIFVIAVGAIGSFVTAGTSVALVVGGVALLGLGIGGEVASALTLKNLNNEKADLLIQKASLKAEVSLALGISGGYESLNNQVKNAVKAARNMANAWQLLSNSVDNLIGNLNKGIISAGVLRKLFLQTANTTLKKVRDDISIIKAQMTGVGNIVAGKDQTVGDAAVDAAEGKRLKSNLFSTTALQSDAPSPRSFQPMARSLKSGTRSGNLSQAVANLEASGSDIQSISNLPSVGVTVQKESVDIISGIASLIRYLQPEVTDFVANANPQLHRVEADLLTDNPPMALIKSAIAGVASKATRIDKIVKSLNITFQNRTQDMNNIYGFLNSVQNDISSQKIRLQVQLESAQREEEAAQKQYLWLIALGPFGLIGLAAALAIYLSTKSVVSDYQTRISALNSQIASLDSINVAFQELSSGLSDVVSKMSSVKNAVAFVSNDVMQVKYDLEQGDSPLIIKIMVRTAITELEKLAVDAS